MTILQSLDRYHGRMAARGEAEAPGWSREKVSFAVVIAADGAPVAIDDLRDHSHRQPRPVLLEVPAAVKRTVGILANLFWDKMAYTLGRTAGKRTMGRKHIIPYGLYRAHGFVSAPLASHPVKGTGFSNADLELLFEALGSMFEHDRSAARGEMATRKLVVFRHASPLGNAQAHDLFARVKTWRVFGSDRHEVGDERTDNWPPARRFEDYAITLNRSELPEGVEIIER